VKIVAPETAKTEFEVRESSDHSGRRKRRLGGGQ